MNHATFDPWTRGFEALLELRSGRLAHATLGEFYHAEAPQEDSLVTHTWFLWLASEAGADLVAPRRAILELIVGRLGREYGSPQPNWLDVGIDGLYAPFLALAYGALSSYRNVTNSVEAVRLLPELKALFFREFLQGGMLKSRVGGEQVFSDIVLCSVPFGLMDAGNQIMVETVARLEQRNYRGGFAFSADSALLGGGPRADLNALLAWYFSERGETSRSRLLLAGLQTTGHESPDELARTSVLRRLAEQNLERLGAGKTGGGRQVLHLPEGHGSRYHFQDRSRVPLQPVEGDVVTLRAVLRPYSAGETLTSRVTVDQDSFDVELVHVGSDGAEGYWEAQLGPFSAGQRVTYQLGAESWTFITGWRVAAVLVQSATGWRAVTPTGESFPVELRTDAESRLQATETGGVALIEQGATLTHSWAGAGLAPLTLELGPEKSILRVTWRFSVETGEQFYGMGERFASLGYRGRRLDSWVFNQYRDQGDRTYIPMPFFQSLGGTGGYGVCIETDSLVEVGFCDRLDGLVEIVAEPDSAGIIPGLSFLTGSPQRITAAWQARSGPAELPPRWTFGPWMSSNNWDNQALTLGEAQKTIDLDLPATVLVLEQWSDEATFYVFNDAVYEPKAGDVAFSLADFRFPPGGRWPDPKAMVATLHEQGLKVLLWQAPVMKYMDGLPHAQRDLDEATMLERGYAVTNPDGSAYRIPDFEWFKRSLVPDFDNAAAAEWWFAKRRYWFTELGIDGVKSDGGEGVYGDNARRNRYPAVYVGAFHRFVQEQTSGKGLTFSRAGFVGAHTVPAHWAGDERSTFEAFRASIRAGLSAGFSGLPFWGFDLGGFNGDIPTAELFLRSAAMAAFCPIMQYHAESKGEKNRDRTPWNIAERTGDPRVLPVYRFFAQARMNLLPYLWDEAQTCVADGTPLMRALTFDYPVDEKLRQVEDEYLLGRALLVAPVVHEGATSRPVVFPNGTWVGLFDRSRVTGPSLQNVVAPLEVLPVWVRAGRLVPLNLGESGQFPSSVGHQVDDYTRLTLLAVLDEPVVALYRTWTGDEIVVNLRWDGGLHGSVKNSSGLPVTLWLDRPGADREVIELLPGKREW